MAITTINPATGETLATYDEFSTSEVNAAIEAAHQAYLGWRETSFAERAERLHALAAILREDQERLATLMTCEMGKPITQARAEIEKCAWGCDFYAEHGEAFLKSEVIETDARKSYVAYRPLGVVLAIMPWNFPFWQVLRYGAPALMAGNATVLKHASNVMGSALAIEELFVRAGFPKGLFRTLVVRSDAVERILDDPRIAAATLTGSTAAGKAVAGAAGSRVKKTVLELGGSDPYLILEDANLDAAVTACAAGRLQNSGQSCIAAKRFIVVDAVREAFEQKLVDAFRTYRMGDPLDDETNIGPLAREDLRDDVHAQVMKSVEAGAKVLIGGEIPEGKGAWYPPTILDSVRQGMPVHDEEVFGPVAAVIATKDEDEAVSIANNTRYGLGAAIFTEDFERGERIAAERIEVGSCFVNAFVKSDPRLPFGGIKESGYGRELSHQGIREFTNIKTIYIA
ncbi:MAG TPA: NAD-dependent succinate-semialdehyde dehydrogenase [Thermomicrobiales bacterium]|nr:NAD-dependent succinate-semialdehyde dehydrogenase [Thermomicrobiales bacterium]